VGRLLDIQVLDSLVIGLTSHVSMKAEDLLP
jgi:DNA repair protein RadC